MDIKELAKINGVTVDVMKAEVDELDGRYSLGVIKHGEYAYHFTAPQYDVLRALTDTEYLVRRMFALNSKSPKNRKRLRTLLEGIASPEFSTWISTQNLSGLSMDEIKSISPVDFSKQTMGRLLRSHGYYSKVVYLGDGRQGRKWFSDDIPDEELSFI